MTSAGRSDGESIGDEHADKHFVALLTPPGRGAVATLRLSGEAALLDRGPLFRSARGQRVADLPFQRIVFGKWGGEEVVVCRHAADTTDIHCHGGRAAVERILADLAQAGCTVLDPAEFLNRTCGTFAAECSAAISRAPTERTVLLLLEHVSSGRLADAVTRLIAEPNLEQVDALLKWADFGTHLIEPWKVAIAGRPNVGKSSLINRLLGYGRAIVSPIAGTTRDVLTATTAFDGWPVELFDTAGIRETSSTLEAAGIARAEVALAQADLAVVVLDRSETPTVEDHQLLALCSDRRASTGQPVPLVVANKADLPDAWGPRLPPSSLTVSCQTATGLDELIRQIVGRLVAETPPRGAAVPFCPRHIECLRSAREYLAAGAIDQSRQWLQAILSSNGNSVDLASGTPSSSEY